jgi:hypothetical protein
MHGNQKELGIIVEMQLHENEQKRYSWPAYVTNLRARHRCPACLLVVTVEERVARWAAEPIPLGPGNYFTPCAIGPSNTPRITEPCIAAENVELAVLSAIEHAEHENTELAARIASTAIHASEAVDAERARLYLDLILMSLSENALQAVQSMNSLGFEYRSDFARKYVAEGRVDIVLKQLALRFGPLQQDTQAKIRAASDAKLGAVAEKLLTAASLADALKPLGRSGGKRRVR